MTKKLLILDAGTDWTTPLRSRGPHGHDDQSHLLGALGRHQEQADVFDVDILCNLLDGKDDEHHWPAAKNVLLSEPLELLLAFLRDHTFTTGQFGIAMINPKEIS